ncbi:MAG: hypothetical protein ACRDGA_05525, partial [Bacteroidota bacterium]
MKNAYTHSAIPTNLPKGDTMKTIAKLFFLLCALSLMAPAQQKVVHFKKLQEFLPSKELKGFKRGKPSGQTQTVMGMTVSEASVRYESTNEGEGPTPSIEVKITDVMGTPMGAMALSMQQMVQGEYENETEDGYEKSVTLKGDYKGLEKAQTGEYK